MVDIFDRGVLPLSTHGYTFVPAEIAKEPNLRLALIGKVLCAADVVAAINEAVKVAMGPNFAHSTWLRERGIHRFHTGVLQIRNYYWKKTNLKHPGLVARRCFERRAGGRRGSRLTSQERQ